MAGFKFLIDTNVVIGLEDDHPVEISLADFARKCSEHGVRLFVHSAVHSDVNRDKDPVRRNLTRSKLRQFETLGELAPIPETTLVAPFGPIESENDRSDVRLLAALYTKAVDFLVTQDAGIHKRAHRARPSARVLTVEEALDWIQQTFEPAEVRLPFIVERKAYEIDRSDPIFASLREGYPGFDKWFDKCVREHRDCWVVELGRELAGIVIRKDENHADAGTKHRGPKILKVCTFKMKPEYRGEKFGEHLLKQILWFAQRNGYDLVYLTAFPEQDFLIDLLLYYGFEETARRENGELVLEKVIAKDPLPACGDSDFLALDRRYYPRFYDGDGVKKFCVPIRADYHRKLFPEIAVPAPLPLFPAETFTPPLIHTKEGTRTPGNTIRKVYLCRAQTNLLRPADLLFFYMSKDDRFRASQSITSVGVVEQVSEVTRVKELLRLTAKRSVFTAKELEAMVNARLSPIKMIDFLLIGHLDDTLPLNALLADGIFRSRPPQSIMVLSPERYNMLRRRLTLGFEL